MTASQAATDPDRNILTAIQHQLHQDLGGDAEQVQVDVINGQVTLTGTVASDDARRRAEELALAASGVAYVVNNLRVAQVGTTGAIG